MGIVLDGQAGFYMADGDLYSPDVSVLSVARWKKLSPKKRRKFIRGSPDLAVEVLSSSEPRRHEEMKIAGYLENDTAIAWLVDIVHQTVTVYTPTGKPRVRSVKDTLTADPIFPGLSIPVPAIFEDVDAG
jgi:Uma2 family endonuclease